MNKEQLQRLVAEFNQHGSGRELAHQLDLHVSLEQGTKEHEVGLQALRSTGETVRQHNEQLLEENRRLQKTHEDFLAKAASEQKQNANVINAQRQEMAAHAREIVVGRFLIALLQKDPEAIRKLQPYLVVVLSHPQDLDPDHLDTVFVELVKLAETHFTNLGRLVREQKQRKDSVRCEKSVEED